MWANFTRNFHRHEHFIYFTQPKKELEDNINLCKLKLDRAEKLLAGLGGEKAAWTQRADELSARLVNLTGLCLLLQLNLQFCDCQMINCC